MNLHGDWWIFYLLVLATRFMGIKFRLSFPKLRGPGFFFSLPVPPDFYDGPGRRLLRTYYWGLPVPYVIEAIVLAPVFYWGHKGWILFTVFLTSMMLAFYGKWWSRRTVRLAKPFALPTEPSPTGVSLGMEPRQLANYRSLPMELFIWIFDLAAIFLLIQSVRISMNFSHLEIGDLVGLLLRLCGFAQATTASGNIYGAWLFWPLILAYIQAGAMLLKYAAVAWPMRISSDAGEDYRRFREAVRRYLIRTCDWFRLVFALALLTTAYEVRFPDIAETYWWKWFNYSSSLSLTAVILIWYYINVRRFTHQARQFKRCGSLPKVSRIIDPSRFSLGGLIYFDPDSPSVVVPSRAGYALNFADRRAYITLAYLGGLALLSLIHLRFGWG